MPSFLAVALIMIFSAASHAAKPKTEEVIVASDRPASGKNFRIPTKARPVYYQIISAGVQELGELVAGEHLPTQEEVEPLVIKALASQYYFPANKEHPEPSLLIVYNWGSINPDEMGGDASDPDAPPPDQLNRGQMLSIVATNKLDLSPNGVDRNLFVPDLSSGRYFLLVGAYDMAALAKGKKVMLWRTRLSTYNSGMEMAAAIPMLLDAGASSFGSDGYPSSVRGKVRTGHVTIGEAKVEEYMAAMPSAKEDKAAAKAAAAKEETPAPAAPATSGTRAP